MAFDIINTVVDHFAASEPGAGGFLDLVNMGVLPDDPSFLKTVSRPPLQDDPTRRALYLVIGPEMDPKDPTAFHRMPVTSVRRGRLGMGTELPHHEVGGGLLFINFFTLEGWVPRQNSRELAYELGMKVFARVERALLRMLRNDFPVLETDDGAENTDELNQSFGYDGGHAWPLGGDREWYFRYALRFHVYSRLVNDETMEI